MFINKYKPKSILIITKKTIDDVLNIMESSAFSITIICTPYKREMAFWVKKINDVRELEEYLNFCPNEILTQEFVDYNIELGVLYYRYPSGKSGISSIVEKEFMTVKGDGHSSIEELMNGQDRSRFQIKRFHEKKSALLNVIPPTWPSVLLEPIGNHCKGARFINGERLINKKLVSDFDESASTMD